MGTEHTVHNLGFSTSFANVVWYLSSELVPLMARTISQGDEASAIWSEMIVMEEGRDKDGIIKALKAYCEMDTLAMVEIHRVLGKL